MHMTAKERLEILHSRTRKDGSPKLDGSTEQARLADDHVELKRGEDISYAKSIQGLYDAQIAHMPDVCQILGITPKEIQDHFSKSQTLQTVEPVPDVAELPKLPGLPELSKVNRLSKAELQSRIEKLHLKNAKRRVWLREDFDTRYHGPQGEARTRKIALWSAPLLLEQVVANTDFQNIRLNPEEGEIEDLSHSMTSQGIKIPITVVEAPNNTVDGPNNTYFLRAGFRRVKAARRLGWTFIPAIILPFNTPQVSEYWANIIENTARKPLHTYELAVAALKMKQDFQITPREFAKITCNDPGYIANLIRAIERLPSEILKSWRERDRIPIGDYIKWSAMTPDEAIKAYYLAWGLRHRQKVEAQIPADPPEKKHGPIREKTATDRGLKRMERLKIAIDSCDHLDEPTKKAYLQIVCFCEGTRDTVPGIFDANVRHRKGEKPIEAAREAREDNLFGSLDNNNEEDDDDEEPVISDVLPIKKKPHPTN